jgi:hypothetical protein
MLPFLLARGLSAPLRGRGAAPSDVFRQGALTANPWAWTILLEVCALAA